MLLVLHSIMSLDNYSYNFRILHWASGQGRRLQSSCNAAHARCRTTHRCIWCLRSASTRKRQILYQLWLDRTLRFQCYCVLQFKHPRLLVNGYVHLDARVELLHNIDCILEFYACGIRHRNRRGTLQLGWKSVRDVSRSNLFDLGLSIKRP